MQCSVNLFRRIDLTKVVKQCKYIYNFSLFLEVRYQKYTGKAIFVTLLIDVGVVIIVIVCCIW